MKFTYPRLLAILMVLFCLSLAGLLSAQTTKPALAWDQAAAGLVEAQSLTVKYYIDKSTTGVLVNGVSCSGTTSPFQCTAPFVGYPAGSHTLTITVTDSIAESVKSNAVPFGPPAAPTNLRITK